MAKYGQYYGQEQFLFDQNLRGIWLFLSLLFKALLNLPHLIFSYLITSTILDKQSSGLTWVSSIILTSYIIHRLFLLFRTWMVQLKERSNRYWIPLFLIALVYSCVLPTWIIWEAISPSLHHFMGTENKCWTLLMATLFSIYLTTHFSPHSHSK
jgi:hypothetical protein